MFDQLGLFFQQVFNVIRTFSWNNFLDICFVAIVIYGAIKIIRETRAVQLLKGMLLLTVVYFLVKLLNMEASTYIMSNIFKNAILILILLFQPEIRHALEQVGKNTLGNWNIFNFSSASEEIQNVQTERMIESVCRACSEMSDQKIGALMVFEREIMLGEIVKTGTVLDAEASKELIGNVFFPKSPLHDGAMVVRNAKIHAAGCILPLTKNDGLSSALGTRHRAALGMSENSDALVVVVSEETGVISLARKGRLIRGLSDGDLRDILTQSLVKKREQSKTGKLFAKVKRGLKK